MLCEKCWSDAFSKGRRTDKSQAECYEEILLERINKPCTPEEKQIDSRRE